MLQHWEGQIESLTARNQTLQSQNESLTARNQAEVEALRAEVERLSVRSPGREGVSGQASQPQLQPGQQLRSPPQPHSHMGSQVQYYMF
jgi:multidrug efflux pump subunit AcrA (membrane-fusion protein)